MGAHRDGYDLFRSDREGLTPAPLPLETRDRATRAVASMSGSAAEATLVLLRLGLIEETDVDPDALSDALALAAGEIHNHHQETP